MDHLDARVRFISMAPLVTLSVSLTAGFFQQQQPTFRTGVEAVVLDVSVLDRNGAPVRGLTAADFTVLEDGQAQAITAFTAVDLPDVGRAGPAFLRDAPRDVRSNDEVREGAIVVLVLDDAVIGLRAALRVRAYAHEVIDRLGPSDVAAVLFVVNKRAGQEFTRDRSRLASAVDRYRAGGAGGGAIGMLAPRMLTDTLRSVVEGLADVPQKRKAIVYVSGGLAFDFAKGAPQGVNFEAILESAATGTDIANLVDFFDAARRANVNVYCLDATGLDASPAAGVSLEREFLQTLSQNTGGFTVTQTEDPAPGIVQMYRENSSYYVIGYVPSNDRRAGRFRRIEVKVNQPGVTVRTRQGYFEPRRVAQAATRRPSPDRLASAMTGFFPQPDVLLQMSAAPFALSGRPEAAVVLLIGVGAADAVDAPAAAADGDVEVLASAYDMLGSLRASERLHVRPRAQREEEDGGTLAVMSHLVLKPGTYHLRVAAASSGRIGSVHYDVEVPDFRGSPLALSGLLLGRPSSVSVPASGLDIALPIAVTVRRMFDATEGVTALVRVYQSGARTLAPVTVLTRIQDAVGTQVFGAERQYESRRFEGARAVDHLVELPLARLAAGQYLLTIEAKAGRRTAARTALFTVR